MKGARESCLAIDRMWLNPPDWGRPFFTPLSLCRVRWWSPPDRPNFNPSCGEGGFERRVRRQTGAGCDGDPGSLSGSGDLGDGGEEDWLGLQNGTSERVAKTLPGPLGSLSPAEPSDRAIPRVSDGPEDHEPHAWRRRSRPVPGEGEDRGRRTGWTSVSQWCLNSSHKRIGSLRIPFWNEGALVWHPKETLWSFCRQRGPGGSSWDAVSWKNI